MATVLYPIQRAVLWPRDLVSEMYNWYEAIELVEQQRSNEVRDMIENARLKMTQSQLSAENNQLRRLLKVKEEAIVPSIAVEILYIPAHPLNQTIIFTKGESDGIKPGMPVIAEGGVVGQIRRVNRNTSEAVLVTNEKISIPAMVQRNGLRVIVFGTDQPNQVEVRYLSNDVDIKAGDTLVTSGIGGYYPSGLSIAEVTSVESKSAQGFVLAVAKPLAHPDRYKHFLVLLTDENEQESFAKLNQLDQTSLLPLVDADKNTKSLSQDKDDEDSSSEASDDQDSQSKSESGDTQDEKEKSSPAKDTSKSNSKEGRE